MSRARDKTNRRLPRNLYYKHGYYSYKDPADGREYGMGRDKWHAVSEAISRNACASGSVVTLPKALSAAEIIAAALPCSELSAIYFLIADDDIIYVGQATNMHRRIAQHLQRKEILFDRYFVLRCPVGLLDILEARYIAAFRPSANRRVLVKAAYL